MADIHTLLGLAEKTLDWAAREIACESGFADVVERAAAVAQTIRRGPSEGEDIEAEEETLP